MAKAPNFDPNKIAAVANAVQVMTREDLDERKTKSKRGIDREATSQVCFRIDKDRHQALKILAVTTGREIGEIMDDLLTKHLGI